MLTRAQGFKLVLLSSLASSGRTDQLDCPDLYLSLAASPLGWGDTRDRLSDGDGGVLLDQDVLQHARDRRFDFEVQLLGHRFGYDLALGDPIAGPFQPSHERDLVNLLVLGSHLRHGYVSCLGTHARSSSSIQSSVAIISVMASRKRPAGTPFTTR